MSNHFRSRGGEQSGRQAGLWEDDDDSSRDIRRARGGGSTSTSSSGGSGSGGGGFGGGRADRGIGHQKFKGQLQLQHNVPPFLQKMMSQNGGAASGLGVSLEGMLSAKTQAAGEGKKRPRHGTHNLACLSLLMGLEVLFYRHGCVIHSCMVIHSSENYIDCRGRRSCDCQLGRLQSERRRLDRG